MINIINLKLNSGFFRTKNYILTIEESKLAMSSDEYGDIYILKDDIRELNLIIKDFDLIDFEIYTKEKIYNGKVDNVANLEELIICFRNMFGNKFKVEIM